MDWTFARESAKREATEQERDWARALAEAAAPGADEGLFSPALEAWDSSWNPVAACALLAGGPGGLLALGALAQRLFQDSREGLPPEEEERRLAWAAALAGAAMAEDMGAGLGRHDAPLARLNAGRAVSMMALAAGLGGMEPFDEAALPWVVGAMAACGRSLADVEAWMRRLDAAPDQTCVAVLAAAAPSALAAWAKADLESEVAAPFAGARARSL